MSFKDHFSTQATIYAKARPVYPPALFASLANLTPGRALVWDCGAGNGQASAGLTAHFDRVVATEPSAAQLAEAVPHPRIAYRQSAELAPELTDGSVDLVTAAQATHWFDRPVFYAEVKRVLRPGGVVAVWTYELCAVTPEIDALVHRFYKGPIGPYWPPERSHCETGYRELDFPFTELPFPEMAMEQRWTLAEFAAYLRTWSAVNHFRKAEGSDPVLSLEKELARLWGEKARKITWPLAGRIGRMPRR